MRMMLALAVTMALAGGAAMDVVHASQGGEQRAQPPRGRGQGLPNPAPGVAVQELQQMFDAYALVQAQRMLQLNDEQYQRFFTRMTRLHELRRQHMRQRARLINDLRRLAGPQAPVTDEAALTTSIQALDALETRFQDDLRAARAAVDEALTVRQRAAFRFFEEEMDRQKIEFLTRARQSGRE